MTETAIALIFGHMLADFAFQSDHMVRTKSQFKCLLIHTLIVIVTAWVSLGLPLVLEPVLIVGLSHMGIDWLKVRWGNKGFRVFMLDQAAHLLIIALVSVCFPMTFSAGIFSETPNERISVIIDIIPVFMAISSGVIFAVIAGGYAVQALMSDVVLPDNGQNKPESMPKGGQMVGKLERLLILMLILAGQVGAIGFLIAAKSVLRFNELARDEGHYATEYVIIGTLASFAWAIGVGFALDMTLEILAAP